MTILSDCRLRLHVIFSDQIGLTFDDPNSKKKFLCMLCGIL